MKKIGLAIFIVSIGICAKGMSTERCSGDGSNPKFVSETLGLVVKDHPLWVSPETMRGKSYGCALVEFAIDDVGEAKEIRVVSSLPSASFGRAAVDAVGKYRFKPGDGITRHLLLLERSLSSLNK
jgi:TonB family protein